MWRGSREAYGRLWASPVWGLVAYGRLVASRKNQRRSAILICAHLRETIEDFPGKRFIYQPISNQPLLLQTLKSKSPKDQVLIIIPATNPSSEFPNPPFPVFLFRCSAAPNYDRRCGTYRDLSDPAASGRNDRGVT